ncbi:SH3 domain-containing protein [Pseudaminobacter sp. NGMCC 1.201702]|uniref:SH3 domain-containing protein n=1 Tax=Pseudaminobacter sp. NGMCC 1.201702 TaxID=3391825 RepID=UPI0039EE768A
MFKSTNDTDEHDADQSEASDNAAPVADTYRRTAPAASPARRAGEAVAGVAQKTAPACRYDWNAKAEDGHAQDDRSVIDRAADIYRLIEAQAVRALPLLRKLAIPSASAVVLAGIGVGTTLLYDPPAIRVEPATFASIEAKAEPKTAPKTDPRPLPIQGVPAPRTASAAAPAPAPATPAEVDTAQAKPTQPGHAPFPLVDDIAKADGKAGPEMAYLPDRATTTGSIPAAVLEAAVKDTRQAPKAAEAADTDGAGRTAHVRKAVNMRASPDQDAKVLTVVPAKASVNVIECKSWCKIAFDGREGWVYKTYIR